MKKLSVILALSFFVGFMVASTANALYINFGDTAKYWPGWGSNRNGYGYVDNNLDIIGDPDFLGGKVNYDPGTNRLIGVEFNVNAWSDGVLSPGDLFISTDADTNWEYVVDLTTWSISSQYNNTKPGAGQYKVYSVELPLGGSPTSGLGYKNNPGYILSGREVSNGPLAVAGNSYPYADGSGNYTYNWNWNGYVIRDDHPDAFDALYGSYQDVGTVDFSGWGANPKFTNFTGGGLQISGDHIIIGWTTNCANDVVYEEIPIPVPEPATMLLLGSGLIGLAGFGRKKFLKRG